MLYLDLDMETSKKIIPQNRMLKLEPTVTVIASKMNDCKQNKLCKPVPEFDIIEKCALCGKLL